MRIRKPAVACALLAGSFAAAQQAPESGTPPQAEAIEARRALHGMLKNRPVRTAYDYVARTYYPADRMVRDGDSVKIATAPPREGRATPTVDAQFSEEHGLPFVESRGRIDVVVHGTQRKVVFEDGNDDYTMVAVASPGKKELFRLSRKADGVEVREEDSDFVPKHFCAGDYVALGLVAIESRNTAWSEATAEDGTALKVGRQGAYTTVAFGESALELRSIETRRDKFEARHEFLGSTTWNGVLLPTASREFQTAADGRPQAEFEYSNIVYVDARPEDLLPPDMDE